MPLDGPLTAETELWDERLGPFARLVPEPHVPPPAGDVAYSYHEFSDGTAALLGRSWSMGAGPGRNDAHAIVGSSVELAPVSTWFFDWPGWFGFQKDRAFTASVIDLRDIREHHERRSHEWLRSVPRGELVAMVRAVLAHVHAPWLELVPGELRPEWGVFVLPLILSPVLSDSTSTFRWTFTTYADLRRPDLMSDGQPWLRFVPVRNLVDTGAPRVDLTEDIRGRPLAALAVALVSRFLDDPGSYSRAITGGLASVHGVDARITTLRVWGPDNVAPRPHVGVLSDTAALRDELGMDEEVAAMAALLAARSTASPLSVAVLGDWGVGKSSFLAQVAVRVDELTLSSTSAPATSAYASNVRQVRFNAWHYSDDHLWTGLVEHLFQALLESPAEDTDVTALEEQLEVEVTEKARLDRELTRIEQVELGGWTGGLNQPFRVQRVLSAAGRSIWREAGRSRSVWLGLALFLAGVAVIVLGFHFGQVVLGLVAGWATAMAGLVAPALAAGQRIGSFVDDQHTKLRTERDEHARRAAELTERLVQRDPAHRLDNLLARITSEGRYADYRGLTGRIHHDLTQLDRGLAEALALWELHGAEGPPPLQRVVLYIDDLDRCQADRVVAVLQAVNLLLTMRLFVVVVAVDPPWLLNALNQHYGPALLSGHDGGRALDYLDKIFDIPYALHVPDQSDTERYFRALLPVADQPLARAARPSPPAPVPTATTGPHPRPTVDNPTSTTSPAAPTEAPRLASPDLTTVTLRLTEQEVAFLARLGPLLVTPRAMKRTSNLYRLLRINNHERIGDFLGGLDTPGPYQAAALLLAAVVGAPDEADSLLTKVAATEDDGTITHALAQWTDLPLAQRLARWFDANPQAHTALTTYRAWVRPVARFGFRTYHLYATGH
jgi:hypothetical protein